MSYLESKRIKQKENQKRVLKAIESGANTTEAAQSVGINRRTIWEWSNTDPDFSTLFDLAWLIGRKQREFTAWLNHPFRGLRPPTGKGTRSKPRFSPH